MNENEVYAAECRTGVLPIQSEISPSLNYFVHPNDSRIAIAGQRGVTILTKKQALAVAAELSEIVRLHVGRTA